MQRLLKRAEFLACAKGARSTRRGFVLQGIRPAEPGPTGEADGAPEPSGAAGMAPGPARLGFTVTRKVGTATERNRVRRRLREALRHLGDTVATPGCDYVLIGRREALHLRFADLEADLTAAFAQVNRQVARGPGRRDGDEDGGARRGAAPHRTGQGAVSTDAGARHRDAASRAGASAKGDAR